MDNHIRGRYETPHTIEIQSKDFIKYISDKFCNIQMYFENRKNLYEEMPDNLQGKLLKRKNLIDYMDYSPSCLSLRAIVSYKMKHILERLNVSKDEYVLKRIFIKGFSGEYYLLFVPIIRDTEFIYPRCVFREMFGEHKITFFNNREEYYEDPKDYDIPILTLKDKYKDYDILSPQVCGCFFSERVLNAMREENVVGYDIKTKGDFYSELYFASE